MRKSVRDRERTKAVRRAARRDENRLKLQCRFLDLRRGKSNKVALKGIGVRTNVDKFQNIECAQSF